MSKMRPVSVQPTRIGKYELGRQLGEGKFGKVRFAKNLETGEGVAIKVLDKAKIFNYKMVEQIKREISIMKLVKHPNIVRLLEVLGSKTRVYIVLEFIMGGELFVRISRQGRFKEDEARKYFQQLINAVDYCHSRGVYHRDLKLENLLLDVKGNLKISDFGLSAVPQQAGVDGLLHTTCGTPNYVAPEVINHKGYDGASADLWSCGVILFVLLAGYLPFDESNLSTLYKKIFRAEFNFPAWFSPGARKLTLRILDPNPSTRITASQILENEWFRKGYKRPVFKVEEDADLSDIDAVFNDSAEHLVQEKKETKPNMMNAFELISLSRGLNFSVLFDEKSEMMKRETRFTSQHPANEIVTKIEEAAKPLGFNVQKRDYKLKLQGDKQGRKGHLSVATEVFEVAPSLFMVELRKSGGDTLEYQNFYNKLWHALQDIVWKSI